MSDRREGVLLRGLDGSNPLAFLAALGTLRILSLAAPRETVRMAWEQADGAWRPRVLPWHAGEAMLDSLQQGLDRKSGHAVFEFADNLNLPVTQFAQHVRAACTAAVAPGGDRGIADFLAAFGCEACADDKGILEDTDLRTMSGAGHQHFLKFFRDIVAQTNVSHLERALLREWDYADPGRGLNLRWDPEDDRRYALRWQNPSNDPNTTMRGANRLAMEALPLLPVMPTSRGAATTGFSGTGARNTFFTWPIWTGWLHVDVVRSLLAATDSWLEPSRRAALGVAAVFRSQRVTVGKFRNFTPAAAI